MHRGGKPKTAEVPASEDTSPKVPAAKEPLTAKPVEKSDEAANRQAEQEAIAAVAKLRATLAEAEAASARAEKNLPGAASMREAVRASQAALPAGLLPAPLATKESPFVNSLGMQFVPVPGTSVLFSKWETRVSDYAEFLAATKREHSAPGFPQGPDHPAVNLSYEDAQAFCQWLGEKEKRPYRLPTDLEWSAAIGLIAEKGETPEDRTMVSDPLRFPWGEWPPPKGTGNFADQTTFRMKAWADAIPDYDDGFAYTAPVGSFPANVLGIHDLSGNAEEWCEDWNNKTLRHRVYRGGSWTDAQKYPLTAGVRLSAEPGNRLPTHGFRCVLDVRK